MHTILIGDIGGTKTTLALLQLSSNQSNYIKQATYPSHDFDQLETLISQFLPQDNELSLQLMVMALAGPIIDGVCHTTNLPWTVSSKQLQQAFGCEQVSLLNDVEASAKGMLSVDPKDLIQLNPGAETKPGHRAVVSVGTGLGEALLFWDGKQHLASSAEGGHEDFAPSIELDIELWRYLKRYYPEHISYERVLSGPGIELVYRFLAEQKQTPVALPAEDTSAWITQSAIDHSDPLSVETMAMFIRLLAKESANLCLKVMALGGVYITGGIPPKIQTLFESQEFAAYFIEKGRFRELLSRVPLWLCLNEDTPLMGALEFAREQLRMRDTSV